MSYRQRDIHPHTPPPPPPPAHTRTHTHTNIDRQTDTDTDTQADRELNSTSAKFLKDQQIYRYPAPAITKNTLTKKQNKKESHMHCPSIYNSNRYQQHPQGTRCAVVAYNTQNNSVWTNSWLTILPSPRDLAVSYPPAPSLLPVTVTPQESKAEPNNDYSRTNRSVAPIAFATSLGMK